MSASMSVSVVVVGVVSAVAASVAASVVVAEAVAEAARRAAVAAAAAAAAVACCPAEPVRVTTAGGVAGAAALRCEAVAGRWEAGAEEQPVSRAPAGTALRVGARVAVQ